MKDETVRSIPMPEVVLPVDFARRVIARARLEQRRQLVRRRMIAAAVAVFAVLPLARSWEPAQNLAYRPGAGALAQTGDEASTEQFSEDLSRTAAPEQVSDYLMPNTAPLRTFAAYSEASWNYDPSWTSDR
ncbi:MAG TPA: hypothetical protein VKS22_13495 [Candidatus Binataceae bacterium]|nr:hypothetical protein [Candidatus Binataceae bacterium]